MLEVYETRQVERELPSAPVDVAAYVALLLIHLHFPDAGSLKGKRKELSVASRRSCTTRLGVAVAEVDHQDLWQRVDAAPAALTSGVERATLDERLPIGVERCARSTRFPQGVRVRASAWRPSTSRRTRMSSERMRRVDEAMREVLSDAVAQDLKDPRVGFVTVTDVKTSPDLRHARVYVSVLGDDDERAATPRRACAPRTASCSARVAARAAPEAHADAEFVYDDTAERAARLERAARRRRRTRRVTTPRAAERTRATQVLDEIRGAERFLLVTHENPDGDALGSLVGDARRPERARQGLGDVHGRATSSRCRTSTASSTLDGLVTRRRPTTSTSARRLPRLRQHRPQPGRRASSATTRTSSTSTTTTTTRASARSTTSSPTRRARPRSSGT